jgi:hypothetical protein
MWPASAVSPMIEPPVMSADAVIVVLVHRSLRRVLLHRAPGAEDLATAT